jgi:hypothetical protein
MSLPASFSRLGHLVGLCGLAGSFASASSGTASSSASSLASGSGSAGLSLASEALANIADNGASLAWNGVRNGIKDTGDTELNTRNDLYTVEC